MIGSVNKWSVVFGQLRNKADPNFSLRNTAASMPFIFAMFEVFAIIFTLIAIFALVYKKTRQIILFSLLNVPVDVFYKRIIADKSRPGMCMVTKYILS